MLESDKKLIAITEAEDEEEEESKSDHEKREISLFSEVCRVLRGMMLNGPGKNFKVKRLVAYTLFPRLFNCVRPILRPPQSAQILTLMEGATRIDWGDRDTNEKQHMPLLNLNK